MGSSPPSADLDAFAREVLAAFFARERGFFLTGGGALVGFHLHHRLTNDLDLFTVEPTAFERGPFVVEDLAAGLGASLVVRQDAPGFKRYAVTRGSETLVIDLVLERSRQACPDKPEHDGVRVDPPEEILANKLTALVGRAEERDLVDVFFLERAGYNVEGALDAALAKDGGCTPATLAWLLSELVISDGSPLPGSVTPTELRAFVKDLVARLLRIAVPPPRSGG